jgi:spore coat polysaccharide biosynthesis predicted glycosyltransferase SpsG
MSLTETRALPSGQPRGLGHAFVASGGELVAIRCDALPETGVGHLVRCTALAEELVSRGYDVTFFGDVTHVPWAARQLEERELPIVSAAPSPKEFAAQVVRAGAARCVVDGYHLPALTGEELRSAGMGVLSIIDGDFGAEQSADLYLDQNLGALPGRGADAAAATLAGLDYVLLRDVVRRRRPRSPLSSEGDRSRSRPRVLAVFGGTDPHAAAAVVAPLVLATGQPCDLTVVAASRDRAGALKALQPGPGQSVEVIAPVDDLPALAVESDLVVSAAGSSTWELLCMGVATALVCVTDNQEMGYAPVVEGGYAAPVGRLEELRRGGASALAAVNVLRHLLGNRMARQALRERGMQQVDGRGRERVADALLSLELRA